MEYILHTKTSVLLWCLVLVILHSASCQYCPRPPASDKRNCPTGCMTDGDCGIVEKCCDDGCGGLKCMLFSKDCPPVPESCTLQCPSGFQVDANGCDVCICHEPCANVTCQADYVCEPTRLTCTKPPCLPRSGCIPLSQANKASGSIISGHTMAALVAVMSWISFLGW